MLDNKIKNYVFISAVILLAALVLRQSLLPIKLHVFAPWSFETRLRRIIELYEQKSPYTKVTLVLGTPGALIKKIEKSEKPDIYIAMGPNEIEILRELKLTLSGKEKELLKQTLVLIAPYPSPVEINSLSDLIKEEIKTVGIGQPKLTAGLKSRKALEKIGLLEKVDKKSKTSPLKSVIFNEVEAAVAYEQCIYEEDLFKGEPVIRRGLKVIQHLPPDICEPFPIIATPLRTNIVKQKASSDFVNFLCEEKAQNILLKKAPFSCPICEIGKNGTCILPQK
ncbi:MAG: substrate-binding domain-containing protein [Candidatus Omnitrophota bacterium]